MGGVPSRDVAPTFYSLRYGTHEVGLIPLVYRYFHSDNKELRQQYIRMRNDPSVRYKFMRSPEDDMKQLPPASYTEEKLDKLLDVIDETLYDSAEAMLSDDTAPLRPVPCAVCFVYVSGREGLDCVSFYGRRINIIGHFGCHKYEDKKDDEPLLYARKAVLKAAGDRTLERVVTLVTLMLKEEFCRVVAAVRPHENAIQLFHSRFTRLPLVTTTPWNSYPTLKFLHDMAALLWAVGNVQDDSDAPRFSSCDTQTSTESGLWMEIPGTLLVRTVMWMCGTLTPSGVRGSWEQFVLDDAQLQRKEQLLAQWFSQSPSVGTFMGGVEFTTRVRRHLSLLLSEVVRARETPAEDQTFWSTSQQYSHDGKLYRVFDSPICGPFLTTVKLRRDAKSGGNNGTHKHTNGNGNGYLNTNDNCNNNGNAAAGNTGVMGGGGPRKHDQPTNGSSLESSVNYMGEEAKKYGVANSQNRIHSNNNNNNMAVNTNNNMMLVSSALPPPPKYQEAVMNSVVPSPYFAHTQPGVPSIPMHAAALQYPGSANSVPTAAMPQPASSVMLVQPYDTSKSFHTPTGTTMVPLYHGTHTPNAAIPMPSMGMSYMMMAPPGQSLQQSHVMGLHHSGNGNVINNNNGSGGGVENNGVPRFMTSSPTGPQQNVGMMSMAPTMNGITLVDPTSMQGAASYVLLPDGRIGLMNTQAPPAVGYWR